ncbi:hypothetical protein [Paractinoplanes maris]|uniref:hypothetical protein n=1 Tax=Paractinoplanes maris TaxID=1734446 RepID=UPI002021D234|nr:hypothetical protein [Actinoplanes maris]
MTEEAVPLTWGVVATVSREAFTTQRGDTQRPGTRYFVPGAKVWVLPIMWGDGGDQRYVVGTRRRTGGRSLIRLVMNTRYLANYRVKPVFSPSLHAAMSQPQSVDQGDALPLYASREEAQQAADSRKWVRTRLVHLALAEWPEPMHNAEETCEFCDGRDAAHAGAPLEPNPHPPPGGGPDGSMDWWGTPYGMWRCGWLTEKRIETPDSLDDLALRHIATARRKLRRQARLLAADVAGRTIAELQPQGIGHARLRFVPENYQPRLLDGVVHAWLDGDERVTRTQFG